MRPIALFLLAAAALAQEAAPALPSGLYAIFSTSMGKFTAKLYEKETPISVANFVALAQGTKPWRDPKTRAMVKRPLYDNITFHRVVPGKAIQSGSANGTIHAQLRHHHPRRVPPWAAVRSPGEAGNGQQRRSRTRVAASSSSPPGPSLEWNGKYAIFGTVVDGLDVVDKIAQRAMPRR